MQTQLKHDQMDQRMLGFDCAQYDRFTTGERSDASIRLNRKAAQLRARVRFTDWAMI